jgi:hypothetical protein
MTDDPFATSDAAYVLGILDLPERRAFELHLQTCDQCVAAVASLRELPELMSLYVPPELAAEQAAEDGDVPDTLLPRLLNEVGRQRRRRRVGLGLAALTAVAASVLAVVLLVGGTSNGTAPTGTPLAMTALVTTPVHATAELRSVAWGTKIDLRCFYNNNLNYPPSGGPPPSPSYALVVIDDKNVAHAAGSWIPVNGQDLSFTSGTSIPRADIKKVQITTSAGVPVLELAL